MQHILLRIQLGVIASYFLVKFWLRPYVLENLNNELLHIFVLSYPNFCEAVAGTIFVTFVLLIANSKAKKTRFELQEKYIPLLSVLLAGVYVLLQEFKIHNLGGNNVYDPYDVLFSLLGLVTIFFVLRYLKPQHIKA